MDIQEYKCAGYAEVSSNIPQQQIDRCEREVIEAYIKPILPTYDTNDSEVKAAIMCLAVLRIQLISIFATRSGAKEKTTAESFAATRDNIRLQYARTADMLLLAMRRKTGANAAAKVNDICGIYFVSNYFYN